MCGIGGLYSTGLSLEQKRGLVSTMTAEMAHRGPDGAATYVDESIALAVTRLAIVDRASSDQLIWNEDATSVIAFNGEVYNHHELRRAFSSRHSFRTRTDTEVALHVIEELGPQGAELLVGDFSLAMWNRDIKEGILVRDRLGVKPIYYAEVARGLVFASEVKPILACFPELAQLDLESIYHYLTYRFVPGPRTIFKSISKLSPGCWLRFSRDGIAVERYWDLKREEVLERLEEELTITGRTLLEQAIRERVPNEVEFGVLLSGGVDSSLIAAIATKASPGPLNTFSVVFLEGQYSDNISEHKYSRLVASIFETNHTELPVSSEMFLQASSKTVLHLEEPVADPPAVLLGLICTTAYDSVTVLLSGEGADELFAGYFVYSEALRGDGVYTGMGRLLTDEEKRALLSPEFLATVGCIDSSRLTRSCPGEAVSSTLDRLHQMLYTDCKYWLVDDLLLKADKMGMMSSVEIRVPYLDHRFVEYAFSVPSNLKLSHETDKYLLRRIAEAYLPPQLTQQPKRGFPLPLGNWLKGPLRSWAEDLLLSSLLNRGYFDIFAFQDLVRDYFGGSESRFMDHVIWSLVVLELFHQEFVDRY